MKTARVGLFVLFALAAFAQLNTAPKLNSASVIQQELDIIRISNQIKETERLVFGIDPGNFATKIPFGTRDLYRVVIQDKLKLAPSYQDADGREDFPTEPSGTQLALTYPTKDVYVVHVVSSDGAEVQNLLLSTSSAERLILIAHEDFHNFRDELGIPRRIAEGFAQAFGHYEARNLLADRLPGTATKDELDRIIQAEMVYEHTTLLCYYELNGIYARASLTPAEKLAARATVFERCSKDMQRPVNNASLAFEMTYATYFSYAFDKLNQYGLPRFVRAYLAVSDDVGNDITDEKYWLNEFEKHLNDGMPVSGTVHTQ